MPFSRAAAAAAGSQIDFSLRNYRAMKLFWSDMCVRAVIMNKKRRRTFYTHVIIRCWSGARKSRRCATKKINHRAHTSGTFNGEQTSHMVHALSSQQWPPLLPAHSLIIKERAKQENREPLFLHFSNIAQRLVSIIGRVFDPRLMRHMLRATAAIPFLRLRPRKVLLV